MKPGVAVVALDGSGTTTRAVVTAVVGAGPSGYKRLDLTVGSDEWADVPHSNDAAVGEDCWLLPTEVTLAAPQDEHSQGE
jgi:hypothetical protein